MNERERLIKQGFNVIAALCFLLIGGRLVSFLSSLFSGGFNLIAFAWLLVTFWLGWSLYSGQLLGRNIMAIVAVVTIFQASLWLLGGALAGVPSMVITQLLVIFFHIGLVYALFFYEPVQQYFRYIGGEHS